MSSGSGIVLGNGNTITPGAAAQPINGVPVSLAPGGSALAVESSTILLGSSYPQQTIEVGGSAMPILYAPSMGGILLPNGQILTPGSSTMINGVPVSLSPSKNGLQIGSSSIALAGSSVSMSDTSQNITVDGKIVPISYATNGAGIILPGGQTLSTGQSTSINGVPIYLASGETAIVINGKTEALQLSAPTSGVGNYIASGIGLSSTSTDGGNYTISSSAPASTVQAAGSGEESILKIERSLWALTAISVILVLR